MAKRRRKASRTQETTRTRKPKERKLIEKGEFVDSLDPPNHTVALDECSEQEIQEMRISRGCRWPLMKLQESSDGGLAGVFVDLIHGEEHWSAWSEHPPSWMDPHLFVKMARDDPRVQDILQVAVKRNSRATWKKLVPLLDEIFAEVYLPYVFQKFEGEARDLLAQWLVRQEAYRETDPRNPKGKK